MLATLGSCDRFFGPRHVQTLSLAARIAEIFRDLGDAQTARALFERVVRDFCQASNRTHATRLTALEALRSLLIGQAEFSKAIAVQTELLECCLLIGGPDAPETVAAKSELASLLMSHSDHIV